MALILLNIKIILVIPPSAEMVFLVPKQLTGLTLNLMSVKCITASFVLIF